MDQDVLIYDKQDHIALITLNRPQVLNALSSDLRSSIHEACSEVQGNDDVRAVIFTGAGRGFCSGADIGGGPDAEDDEVRTGQSEMLDQLAWMGELAMAVYGLDKPTIAAMNGVCAGLG